MGTTKIELKLLAEPNSVATARHAVVELARQDRRSERALKAVALAVSEAATNVVVHAYRGDRVPGPLHVSAQLVDRGLQVEVSDHGPGITPRVDSPGLGLGMPLIASLATSVDVGRDAEGRTCVRMCFLDDDLPRSLAAARAPALVPAGDPR